jgi:amidase
VDAGGRDANGVRRSLGGNPQTGPFYIEGAMPGDTLSVKFTRIRMNRDTAQSGNAIVPSALAPGYFRDAKLDNNFNSEWKLDRETGYGTLAKPTERLKNFRVRLNPMLGCVAVPGALLFVGDGHAAQGDGELNGDALETSMDIEFTVNLIRGQTTQQPRMESDEWIMASGIANSLPEALQYATTALVRWLERDYKLAPNEAAIVAGTSIRYDIAEVVDPQVHIVARIARDVLAPLK